MANSDSITQYLVPRARPSSEINTQEQAMYDYTRFLVSNTLPLTTITKETFRNISKYPYKFGRKSFRLVMLQLIQIVEEKVG